MGKENRHGEEFQKEAVRLYLTSGKTQTALAKELGISAGTLLSWRRKHDLKLPGNEALKAAADERVRQLEKENARLRQERDILKKSLGIALAP
jgi:transposase